uniref:Uncharacterized protein n=2 Tax=Pyricularia oryzae TaxID=318829 RepID=Q2KGM3_PYRO7|nr:hypothetical protein MGCH7_ch7g312 [Pyricularia oryzae 70-15]
MNLDIGCALRTGLLYRIAGGKLGWSGNLRHKQSAHVHNAYYNGPLNCQLHNSTPVNSSARDSHMVDIPAGRAKWATTPHACRISRRMGRDAKDDTSCKVHPLQFSYFVHDDCYNCTVDVDFWRQANRCDRPAEASWACLARVVQIECRGEGSTVKKTSEAKHFGMQGSTSVAVSLHEGFSSTLHRGILGGVSTN